MDIPRAVAAAASTASALGLAVDDATVLHRSNRIAVRLLPCGVVARVTERALDAAQFEVELAQQLTDCPVGGLAPGVESRLYQRDGFGITLWTYFEPVTAGEPAPADYAGALARLHAGMRPVTFPTPHFMDRVTQARQLVVSTELTPALTDADRQLLGETLRRRADAITRRGAPEQLLHGEPHPGNVLSTKEGLLFIDLETCCRGPVEFDLAHVPVAVSDLSPDADPELLAECRVLVLAMVAAWRWERDDSLPHGLQAGHDLISALRQGPPWPALNVVMGGLGGPL